MIFWLAILIFGSAINRGESIDCDANPKNTEGRLRKHLFCNYDKSIRPVTNSKNATTVNVTLIVQNYDFSDWSQQLSISSWISMKWMDEHLKWDRSAFDNIDKLTVNNEDIWSPDLTIYNSGTTQFSESCSASHCVLSSSGLISCIPPCTHTGTCFADYTYWPFDTQNCSMHFGAWVHRGEEIDFRAIGGGGMETAVANNEWKWVRFGVQRKPGNYSWSTGETYPSLHYWFVIERHFAGEMAYIFVPSMVITVLNVLSTLLDPNCFERIAVVIISFFSHIKFIQQLGWTAPKNGDKAPNFVLYYRDSLIISAFLLFHTIIMRALTSCTSKSPDWVETATSKFQDNKVGEIIMSKDYLIQRNPLSNEIAPEDVASLVEGQTNDAAKQKEQNTVWRTTVKVLDRLLFIILTIVYIIMILTLIPGSYHTS